MHRRPVLTALSQRRAARAALATPLWRCTMRKPESAGAARAARFTTALPGASKKTALCSGRNASIAGGRRCAADCDRRPVCASVSWRLTRIDREVNRGSPHHAQGTGSSKRLGRSRAGPVAGDSGLKPGFHQPRFAARARACGRNRHGELPATRTTRARSAVAAGFDRCIESRVTRGEARLAPPVQFADPASSQAAADFPLHDIPASQ